MQGWIRVILTVFTITASSFAGASFQAQTTLTAEASNNTSAANSFVSQTNGNLGSTNVSKVSLRTLLYPGSTAKIYAHLVVWFGFGTNMDVGYTSSDPTQVHNQVTDMISRGIDGTIIDWYGQGKMNPSFVNYDQATQAVMQESQQHPNFNFAIMDDGGSLRTCSQTTGCDVTQTVINDLTYAYNTYETSSAYLYFNNRPVVYFFGMEFYSIDWNHVRASEPGNPLFIFRNTGGFSSAQSNGAFAWVEPETVTATDSMGLGYMGTFDGLALSSLPTYSNVAGYKGFDDSLASWGSNRLVQQQCGQTWLQTVALANNYFSTSQQMLGIQLVTWNDYEEGTEFESGIDNCVSLTAWAQGSVVSWSITGQSNTVDHYTAFASEDGQNLMWLADVPTSTQSLDVSQFNLNAGTYTAYVKAVGKPSLANKMSSAVSVTITRQPPAIILTVSPSSGAAPLTVNAAVSGGSSGTTKIDFGDGTPIVATSSATHVYTTQGSYTVTGSSTDASGVSTSVKTTVTVSGPGTFAFSANGNTSATVVAGQAATFNLVLASKSSFVGTVSLSCAGAPTGVSCNVNPGAATFSSSTISVPVTVTAATTPQARLTSPGFWTMPVTFAAIFAGGFCAARKRTRPIILTALAAFVILGIVACGGGKSSANNQPPAPAAPTIATLTVTGSGGGQSATTTLILTITH